MLRRIPMLASVLVLGACASGGMTEAECRLASWRAIGFEDGARGLGPEAIRSHRMACAEHGVALGFEEYMVGHEEGLRAYCRPQNGSAVGANGQHYTGVCPPDLEDAFLEAHETGFGLFERRSRLLGLERSLIASRTRADRVEHLLVEKSARMIGPDLLPSERASLAVELKQLGIERGRLEAKIDRLELECAEAEEELQRYRGELARND